MVSIRGSGKFTRVEEGSFGEGQLVVVGDEKGSIQTGYIYPSYGPDGSKMFQSYRENITYFLCFPRKEL